MPQTAQSATIEDILFKQGVLSHDQLSMLKLESINSGKPIEAIITERNFVPADKLIQAKAQILNLPFVKLEGKAISSEVLNLIPEPAARRYKLIPFEKTKDELFVAMEDPLDIQVIQFVEKRSGMRIKSFLAGSEDILQKITEQYSQNMTTDVTSALKEVQSVRTKTEIVSDQPEIIREAPVSNIINQLLELAIKE